MTEPTAKRTVSPHVQYVREHAGEWARENKAREDKARENRFRRAVERRGFKLQKSSVRDTAAPDYGTYQISDPASRSVVYRNQTMPEKIGYGLSLDDVQTWLFGGIEPGVLPASIDRGKRWVHIETLPKGEQKAIAEMMERLRQLHAQDPAAFAASVRFIAANMDAVDVWGKH